MRTRHCGTFDAVAVCVVSVLDGLWAAIGWLHYALSVSGAVSFTGDLLPQISAQLGYVPPESHVIAPTEPHPLGPVRRMRAVWLLGRWAPLLGDESVASPEAVAACWQLLLAALQPQCEPNAAVRLW